jgi:DNA-binding LacI/PurR family transcriptional regulator
MAEVRFLTITEQVAEHLRRELARGRWTGRMPGKHELAAELAVNNKTVEAALRQLETRGLLVSQGAGRRRTIPAGERPQRKMLRIALLVSDNTDLGLDYIVELRHRLQKAGHAVQIAPRTIVELRDDAGRLAAMVRSTDADAWIVEGGSRKILEWFSGRPEPAFALFGRRGGLPIAAAGPHKPTTYCAATRELIRLGHRRIVLMVRPRRRLPEPGAPEKAFLAELAAHGLAVGDYNLPAWEESPKDFHRCLEELFRVTPPTAMIIDETEFFFATQQFLSRRGLRVPEDVSLIATDPDPTFHWCRPSIAHITWESGPLVQRIVRWASNVSGGKDDRRQTLTKAEFVTGGTIGPAKER